jgi:ATPase subunit of ABC transporter with duplicated ATPase domains
MLLKMVSGSRDPDAGTVKLGASLKLGYFAQRSLELLDPSCTVIEQLQKEMLVEALHAFEGTMLLVSHDRTFLRGLASRVLEIGGEDGTGKPVTYGGTYEEYVAKSGHEAPGVHA